LPPQGILSGLNEKQLEAVTYDGASLLILAGAGSGKTRVITTRIAYLIAGGDVRPSSILAVTFTNKAAREMRDRVGRMVPGAKDIMVRTFHSFCSWFLRRNGSLIGINPHFVIYDDDDSLALLKGLYPNLPNGEFKKHAFSISRAKDDGLGPEDDLSSISFDPDFSEIYGTYQRRLEEVGNVDFGSLITFTLRILQDFPEVKKRTQQRFPVLLVDEYQDSNGAQHQLMRELVAPGSSICVVGDDDQSIYRFRGAEVKNIVNFPEHFPGTRVIRLEQNYRSTGNILKIASAVVAQNQDRLGKTLWTKKEEGPKARLQGLDDQEAEAKYVAEQLDRTKLDGSAILYRTNAQSRPFESLFVKMKIPYRVVGTVKFYSREEIKDTLAYLALMLNPKDQVAFSRVVNKPARGLGKQTLGKINEDLESAGGDYLSAAALTAERLPARAKKGLLAFLKVIHQSRLMLEEPRNLPEVLQFLYMESGLWEHYKAIDLNKHTMKLANMEELYNASAPFGGGVDALVTFLESVELDSSSDEEDGVQKVTLITMHNTKGLEFDRVFITGMEEGLFPRSSVELDPAELEEERRLFYVAITRAREELTLTTCSRRMIHGRTLPSWPSRFLSEIPKECLESDSAQPGYSQIQGLYPRGTKIYHDDYGAGYVAKEVRLGGEYLVEVQFESGQRKKFFPEFTPLEKISDDY
jgi:DNA helicase-2/ATP-dependent DNA helicase PcrA